MGMPRRDEARRGALRIAQLAVWCGAALCLGVRLEWNEPAMAGPTMAQMNQENKESKEAPICIGRFRFSIPETLVVNGRSQSIYHVEVNTVAMPRGGIRELWGKEMARLEALGPTMGTKSAVVGELELEAGMRAIWYADNPTSPQLHELVAMKAFGDHVVRATRGGEASKHEIVETLVRGVINDYAATPASGFCLEEGAITSEPSLNEKALVSFAHRKLADFDIEFATTTVSEPELGVTEEEEKEAAESDGGTYAELRNQQRTAAGLEGKERMSAVALPGRKSLVRFTWHFPGIPESSSGPNVDITASAPKEHRAELEKIWETMLKSLRPVPVAGGAQR
jgi:hypothetical protein